MNGNRDLREVIDNSEGQSRIFRGNRELGGGKLELWAAFDN